MLDLSNVTNITLNGTEVTQIEDSLGTVLWTSVKPDYFYVEDISGSDNTLTVMKSNSGAPTLTVYTSTDLNTWRSNGTTSTYPYVTFTIPANSKLYVKCTTDAWSSPSLYYNIINASERHNVGGNIMSLLYGDNFENQTTLINSYTFKGLFNGNNKLENAENLILPATNTTRECYFNMFNNCTNLVTAPALPATTLTQECYRSMFRGCTSLTTAPALPATSLANNCYMNMFNGCTSLNSVTTYAQDISASSCLSDWLNNVAATGDFYNLGGATYPSGGSGIPTGWTEHNSL